MSLKEQAVRSKSRVDNEGSLEISETLLRLLVCSSTRAHSILLIQCFCAAVEVGGIP